MMNTTASARKLKAKSQIYFRIFLSTVEFDFKWKIFVSPLQEKKNDCFFLRSCPRPFASVEFVDDF